MNRQAPPRNCRLPVVLIVVALVAIGCSSQTSDPGATDQPSTDSQEQAGDPNAAADAEPEDEAAEPGVEASADTGGEAGNDDDESDGAAPSAGTDEDLLAALENEVTSLGDVLGVERPAGLEPTTTRVDTYPRLCPTDDLPVSAILQQDPLIENLPVQRYFIVFPSPDQATAFAEELAATEVGCVGVREGEVSVATSTITNVQPLDVGAASARIEAAIEVDMINLDQDPPGSDVHRSIAQQANTVIVVVSLADYDTFVGTEVHTTLLVDGIAVVAEGSS